MKNIIFKFIFFLIIRNISNKYKILNYTKYKLK